jgi:hypothetical protein
MADEARDLGIVLDGDAYEAADKFQDSLTEMRGKLQGTLLEAIVPLLPQIEEMAAKFTDAATTAIPQLIQSMTDAAPVIMAVVKALAMAADGLSRLQGQDNLDAFIAIASEAHNTAMTVNEINAALEVLSRLLPSLRPSGSVEDSVFGGQGFASVFNQPWAVTGMPDSGGTGGGSSPLAPMVKDAKDIALSFEGIKATWEDIGKDAITGDVLRMQEEKGQMIADALQLQADRSREISDLLTNGARDFVQTMLRGGDDWGENMLKVITQMALKFAAMQIGGPIGGFLGAFL